MRGKWNARVGKDEGGKKRGKGVGGQRKMKGKGVVGRRRWRGRAE
jgi:hypothetical protein